MSLAEINSLFISAGLTLRIRQLWYLIRTSAVEKATHSQKSALAPRDLGLRIAPNIAVYT